MHFRRISDVKPGVSTLFLRQRRYLGEALRGKGVWLWAQAGSGKSAAVASFLSESEARGIWCSLGDGDSELQPLYRHLRSALNTPHPDTDQEGEFLIDHLRNVCGALFRGVLTPVVLIFDDCHCVNEDAPLWRFLHHCFEEAPIGVSFIFISRQRPHGIFSNNLAKRQLALLRQEVFRLEEADAVDFLAQQHPVLPLMARKEIAQRCGGWMMALNLLGEWATASRTTDGVPPVLQDYLETQFFSSHAQADRELLLELALLPAIDPAQATALTGQKGVGERLERLAQECLLVARSGEAPNVKYVMQPVLREFLLAKAPRMLERKRLVQLCARMLPVIPDMESSAPIIRVLAELHAWSEISGHVAASINRVLVPGSGQVLEKWLDHVPPAVLSEDPWLSYAEGHCHVLRSSFSEAYACFLMAWEGFRQGGDTEGQLLAWAGAVNALHQGERDLFLMDEWISRIDDMLKDGMLPNSRAGVMVAQHGLVPLFLRAPGHPCVAKWAAMLEHVIHRRESYSDVMLAALPLMRYKSWNGASQKARALIEAIPPPEAAHPVPFDRIAWHAIQAMGGLHGGSYSHVLEHVHAALGMLPQNAMPAMRWRILICGGYAAIEHGDHEQANWFLQAARGMRRLVTPFDEAQYHFIAGWALLLQEQHAASRAHFEEAIDLMRACNIRWGLAHTHASLAHALIPLGHYHEAAIHIASAEQMDGNSCSRMLQHFITLTRAWYELETGGRESGMAHLKNAFALARSEDFRSSPWITRSFLIRMCMYAIEHRIEVAFIQRLVRETGLVPESPPIEISEWPWPVRIFTLGRFGLLKDDQPLPTSSKGHGKPIELLKLMVAMGGRDVPKQALLEILWPELDGDFAEKSFDTTLYRLRKLVGHERFVQVHGGTLSLDQNLVWVDIWALGRVLGAVHPDREGLDPSRLVAMADKLMALYSGDFLGADGSYPHYERKRRQLRRMFMEEVVDIASLMTAAGREKEARELYRQALQRLGDAPEIQSRLDALGKHPA